MNVLILKHAEIEGPEWMEAFEEESGNLHPSSFSKTEILTETEIKIETCTRRGMTFLENFFNNRIPPRPPYEREAGGSGGR